MLPRGRIGLRAGVRVMPDCTAVLQCLERDSSIDWIRDYRSVADYSPHINDIVCGRRARPVQAGASKLRANEVNATTLWRIIPELLYEGQTLLFTSARIVLDAGGYTSFEKENHPTVAKTFEVLRLVKVQVLFRLTRSEFTPRRDEHDPVAAVGTME